MVATEKKEKKGRREACCCLPVLENKLCQTFLIILSGTFASVDTVNCMCAMESLTDLATVFFGGGRGLFIPVARQVSGGG